MSSFDERGGKWIGCLLIIDDVISNELLSVEVEEHVSHIDDDAADDDVSTASANVRQIDFDDAIDGLIVFVCCW